MPKGILSSIKCAGWASKISKAQLAQALSNLPEIKDPNLLVGLNTADDAMVYKVTEELALVYTIDALAPMIEDAYTFGKIAATNCISDIYAMGGEPKLALNIIGYPAKDDPLVLGEILRGGQEKAQEAGITLAGGHTFNAEGIVYGMTVLGYIHPEKITTNAGARDGDVIVLTKPIGVGSIIQAILLDRADSIDLKPVIEAMTTLNKKASVAMRAVNTRAATDITGYGLVGHLVEMAEASNVGIELWTSKIPVYAEAIELLKTGVSEPGIMMNINSFKSKVKIQGVDEGATKIYFGAETSGGLAIVIPEKKVDEFIREYGRSVPVIGRVTKENRGLLTLLPWIEPMPLFLFTDNEARSARLGYMIDKALVLGKYCAIINRY